RLATDSPLSRSTVSVPLHGGYRPGDLQGFGLQAVSPPLARLSVEGCNSQCGSAEGPRPEGRRRARKAAQHRLVSLQKRAPSPFLETRVRQRKRPLTTRERVPSPAQSTP